MKNSESQQYTDYLFLALSAKPPADLSTARDISQYKKMILTNIDHAILKGANINAQCSQTGNTPLHIAIINKDIDQISILINYGANFFIKNYSKHSPEDYMNHLKQNNKGFFKQISPLLDPKYINRISDLNTPYIHADTPLNNAVLHRDNLELLRVLAEEPKVVNIVNNHGNTALHLAAMHDNLEALTSLIIYGANPDLENHDRYTALDIAISHSNVAIMSFLINYIEVNNRAQHLERSDPYGNNAAHFAIINHNIEALRLSIFNGANLINMKNKQGLTPLALALIQRNTAMVIFLVDIERGIASIDDLQYLTQEALEKYKLLYQKNPLMMELWDEFLKKIKPLYPTDSSLYISSAESSVQQSTNSSAADENVKEDTSFFMGEALHQHYQSF